MTRTFRSFAFESGLFGMKSALSALIFLMAVAPPAPVSAQARDGQLPPRQLGANLSDCLGKLARQNGGWCEIRNTGGKPSIASVWPKKLDKKTRMVVGPQAVLVAWNSAAYDHERDRMYFLGGGHADYGGNEVYEFDLRQGRWRRLTDPSPLDHLFVGRDYDSRSDKPWRRLCWMQNVSKVPASAHTYDGLLFSAKTDTLFYYVMRAANGSCLEDKADRHRDDPAVLGRRLPTSRGWYEFNPSRSSERNGLAPLAWRKVFDHEQLKSGSANGNFPVTAELADGRIVLGSVRGAAIYDPADPDASGLKRFMRAPADFGDGAIEYDAGRDLLWSIHSAALLAFDGRSGRFLRRLNTEVLHGKSLAIDKVGNLVFWNGLSKVFMVNPDERAPPWREIDWAAQGPQFGDTKVYGKWVYLKAHDVFAGISSHRTGFWIYRQPPSP